MVRIKREVDFGMGIKVNLIIDDNIALMTCNYPDALEKIYLKARENKQDVEFDTETKTMIEHHKMKAEDYNKLISKDVQTAMKKKEEAIRDGKKGINRNKKE